MPLIAEINIGNATTEVALAQGGRFIASGIVATIGMKNTREDIAGMVASLQQALDKTSWSLQNVAKICINEVAPMIGNVATETIIETIITESTMTGYNPQTPGGVGVSMGTTIAVEKLMALSEDRFAQDRILLVGEGMDFLEAVWFINEALDRGVNMVVAIPKEDDGVLVNNRLHRPIPVIDEVTLLEKVPEGVLVAVGVTAPGQAVRVLSNSHGIMIFFALTPEKMQTIVPIARALIGNHFAVVLKTPQGDVCSRVIPAGKIVIRGEKRSGKADIA